MTRKIATFFIVFMVGATLGAANANTVLTWLAEGFPATLNTVVIQPIKTLIDNVGDVQIFDS